MLCAVTHGWLQLVFVTACKLGITGALVLGPLYAEELFPGNVRSAASRVCSLVQPCHPVALNAQMSWYTIHSA